MKFSLVLSALILVIGTSVAWLDHQQLAVIRENHSKLAAEAADLGIAPDGSRKAGTSRGTKRTRSDQPMSPGTLVADLVAFFEEAKSGKKQPDLPEGAVTMGPPTLLEDVKSLDPSQLKALIVGLCATQDLNDEQRDPIVRLALRLLVEDHPQAALALFKEIPDLLKNDTYQRNECFSTSLSNWANADPAATVEWVRKNAEKLPDLVTDRAKQTMLAGMAATDPRLAFKLVGELGFQEPWQALYEIGNSAKTPDEQTATLAAIREHAATLPEGEDRNTIQNSVLSALTRKVADGGFATATQWFAAANFSPAELVTAAHSLDTSVRPEETGQWITWVSENLPAGKSEAPIREIVSKWTQRDYPAAGKWLATTPASPTKNTAIRSYAETVSTLDPATATQWAMTLPPGPDRDATLKHIQDHPPTK